jgi:hypothetical protein
MEDRESWLPALLENEPDGKREAAKLCATAALARGALNAVEPPESLQSAARAKALETLQQLTSARQPPAAPATPWTSRLGSWLQVVFNLFRRR